MEPFENPQVPFYRVFYRRLLHNHFVLVYIFVYLRISVLNVSSNIYLPIRCYVSRLIKAIKICFVVFVVTATTQTLLCFVYLLWGGLVSFVGVTLSDSLSTLKKL